MHPQVSEVENPWKIDVSWCSLGGLLFHLTRQSDNISYEHTFLGKVPSEKVAFEDCKNPFNICLRSSTFVFVVSRAPFLLHAFLVRKPVTLFDLPPKSVLLL